MGKARRGAELGRRVRRSGERLLDPANAFAEPASYPPRREQRGRERKRCLRIDQEQARERDAQVVVDARERVEVRPLGLGHQADACLKGDTEVEARMTFTDGVDFAGGDELLDGVLPDGLEQLIPAAVAELQKERLLDEPGREIGDPRGRLAVDRADLLDRAKLEPAGENAHAAEQAPLVFGEEGIAPLHGGAEGSLGPVGAPCGLREQREQIVEVRGDVLRIEAGHARGGELDGEREPVDAAANLSEQSAGALGVERSLRARTGALSEQLNRAARRDLLEARVRTHHGQRSKPVGHLAVDPQRLSTRRENAKPRESRRQRRGEIGDGGHDVLAVVDHQQHIAFGEPARERVFVGLPTRPRQPELDGHLGRNEIGRPQRAEPNDGHAAGKVP